MCTRVWKNEKKKAENAKGAEGGTARSQANDRAGEGRGGDGGLVGRRWNHKSVKMFCNFEIRHVPAGLRQSALPETANRWACGQHRRPQKRIAVPPGNAH